MTAPAMGAFGFPTRIGIPLPQAPLRYAITSGSGALPEEFAQLARQWVAAGVDVIQLREPALSAGALYHAAHAMLATIASQSAGTKLLVNGRADIAIAAGAHGVHLTSRPGELTAPQVRALYAQANLPRPMVSLSTHTLDDIRRAREQQVDLVLFGPIFEKRVQDQLVVEGIGLQRLREACAEAGNVPVLALGGVTLANTPLCLEAGAAGIAAIRLFGER